MVGWTEQIDSKAALIADQMRTATALVARFGTPEDNPVAPYIAMLRDLYRDELPVARVLDNSDIVLRAEGPGAAHDFPWLSALNWVSATAETNIRHLSSALFDLLGADGKALVKTLDLRLSGVAQGSLLLGVKLMPPPEDLLPEDIALIANLTGQIGNLPEITRFIDDEGLRPGIEEAAPDPAMRDAQLAALYRFSPTGKRGIHTLEISSRGSGIASLSQRERVVLREVIAHPDARKSIAGTFTGHVREADLDKTRFHLRGVEGVGTLRCILPSMTAEHAKIFLGSLVRVEGRYHTDRNGRPRLLFVDRITPVEQAHIPET